MNRLTDRLFAAFERNSWNRTWFALVWSLVFFVVLLSIVTPTFKINDNAGLLLNIFADLETPFMSKLMVKGFSFLYLSVSGDVPWYGIACYLAQFWAMALFVHSLGVIERAKRMYVPLVALYSLIAVTFVIRCGYNSSSILLSGVSVLAFLAYVREDRATKLNVLMCALGLVFAFLFRPRGMQGAMLYIAPAVVAFGALNLRMYRPWMLALFLAPIGTVALAHTAYDTLFVSDEFREYQQFNRKRGKFHAYPISRVNVGNQDILDANDWKQFHYYLLLSWFFVDEERWNTETISNIFTHSRELPHENVSTEFLGAVIGKIAETYAEFLALLPLFAALVWLSGSKWVAFWSAGYLLYLLVVTIFMTIVLRFPDRVGEPMFTTVAVAALWISLSGRDRTWSSAKIPHAGLVAVLAAIWPVIVFIGDHSHQMRAAVRQNKLFERTLADLNNWFDGYVLFVQPAILHTVYQNPLKVYDYKYKNVPSGWRTFSPLFYKMLESEGLERGSELIPHAIDNPDFFFMFQKNVTGWIIQFVRDQYGIECKIRVWEDLGTKRYVVFQLVTNPNPTFEPDRIPLEVKRGTPPRKSRQSPR